METLSLKKDTPRIEAIRKEKIAALANTTAADKKAKYKRLANCRKYLRETYPIAFNIDDPKPLAIGINEQLVSEPMPDGMTKTLLRHALSAWIHRKQYQAAVRVGAERVNLDGTVFGVIDAKQVEYKAEKKKQPKTTTKEVNE